jgi:actin-like ATPase involved in cell morphogenesis
MSELSASEIEKLQKLQARVKRQNEKQREQYDRVSVCLPKGTSAQIKEAIKGESVNKYITELVLTDLRRRKAVADSRRQITYPDDAVEIEI